MKFDHIGVVVPDLAAGRRLLSETIDVGRWTEEFKDPVNGIYAQFGSCPSGVCYELVAPLSEQSPVWASLTKKVNVINHVAYLVSDLAAQRAKLKLVGFVAISEAKPAIAYSGRPIQFFVSQARFIIELIEAPDHTHRFSGPGSAATRGAIGRWSDP